MQKFKDYIILKYPQNFDVSLMMVQYELQVRANQKNLDKQREYLYIIIDQVLKARENYQTKVNDFNPAIEFPVCTEILRQYVRDYNEYLNFLGQVGFVDEVQEPQFGSCAYYRICDPYDQPTYTNYYLFKKSNSKQNKAFELLQHDAKYDERAIKDHEIQYESYKHITVDLRRAEEQLNYLYPQNKILQGIDEEEKIRLEEVNRNNANQISNQMRSLKLINDFGQEDYVTLSPFHTDSQGRLYTPICNLNKKLRQHFSLIGREIFEEDVKNSIPFASTIFFTKYDSESQNIIQKVRSKGREQREEEKWEQAWRTIMLFKKGPEIENEDVKRYVALIQEGRIYEELGKIWDMDRSTAKTKFLALCNTPPKLLDYNLEWSKFDHYFPTVAAHIENINKTFRYTKEEAFRINRDKKRTKIPVKDYTCPYAIITQSLEAQLILHEVVPAVVRLDPTVKLITLHDAIYTTEEHVEIVKQAFEQVYEFYFNCAPQVKVKGTRNSEV